MSHDIYMLDTIKPHYFRLRRNRNLIKKAALFLIKLPFLFLIAIFSALVTVLAMAPNFAPRQHMINHMHLCDDKQDLGIVIINLTPRASFKTFFDFIHKPLFVLKQFLPFLPINQRPNQLSFTNKQDKAYIDKVCQEYKNLINGISKQKHCENRTFPAACIYFKGLEFLDDNLKQYFEDKISELNTKSASINRSTEDINSKEQLPKIDFFSLETPGGATLDSVEVTSIQHTHTPFTQRKFVITCMARDQNFMHWIKELKCISEQSTHATTTISFNYRGSDRSHGMLWSGNNMVNDAVAQVHRLLAMGVSAQNITIEGHCIGGNVATLAAAKLHRHGHYVKIYNDRSMRSINRLLLGLFWPKPTDKFWHPITWLKCFMVLIEYCIVLPALWFTKWRLDAANALDSINTKYFDYSFVNNPDAENSSYKEDGLVQGSWASIASKVEEKLKNDLTNHNLNNHCFKVNTSAITSDDTKHLCSRAPHCLPRRKLVSCADGITTIRDSIIKHSLLTPL